MLAQHTPTTDQTTENYDAMVEVLKERSERGSGLLSTDTTVPILDAYQPDVEDLRKLRTEKGIKPESILASARVKYAGAKEQALREAGDRSGANDFGQFLVEELLALGSDRWRMYRADDIKSSSSRLPLGLYLYRYIFDALEKVADQPGSQIKKWLTESSTKEDFDWDTSLGNPLRAVGFCSTVMLTDPDKSEGWAKVTGIDFSRLIEPAQGMLSEAIESQNWRHVQLYSKFINLMATDLHPMWRS